MKLRKMMVGLVVGMLLASVAAQAHAAGVSCKRKKPGTVDRKGADGSECFVGSDGTGTARSKAVGNKSFADAELQTHGKAKATATGGSFSEATSDTGGNSSSNASGGSSVTATSDMHGVAKGTASGSMAEADPSAFGKCKATATATGAGSFAKADCGTNGTFATATATGGGTAKAFDNMTPTCTATTGQTAMVTSSGGTCSAP